MKHHPNTNTSCIYPFVNIYCSSSLFYSLRPWPKTWFQYSWLRKKAGKWMYGRKEKDLMQSAVKCLLCMLQQCNSVSFEMQAKVVPTLLSKNLIKQKKMTQIVNFFHQREVSYCIPLAKNKKDFYKNLVIYLSIFYGCKMGCKYSFSVEQYRIYINMYINTAPCNNRKE